MKNIIEHIKDSWYKNIGTDDETITMVEQLIKINFPDNYKYFVKWSNGGEGNIKNNYISLWKIEDLKTLNEEYQIQKYLSKKFIAIGTDGGGTCYGYKFSKNFTEIFKCSLGDLDINEVVIIGKSLVELFEKKE